MALSPARDFFPSTHETWLHTRIEAISCGDGLIALQAAQEIREHLMERYAEPLTAYVRGSSLATLGEPTEIVHGFFARSLADAAFTVRWSERGGPLRRWMINGLLLHARGVVRDRARNREHSMTDSAQLESTLASPEPPAERAFELAWSLALLGAACNDVAESFARDGREQAFEIFRQHVVEGKSYPTIEGELGVDPVRAATEVRAVTRALRESLLERLREEGLVGDEIEREVASILRRVGQV